MSRIRIQAIILAISGVLIVSLLALMVQSPTRSTTAATPSNPTPTPPQGIPPQATATTVPTIVPNPALQVRPGPTVAPTPKPSGAGVAAPLAPPLGSYYRIAQNDPNDLGTYYQDGAGTNVMQFLGAEVLSTYITVCDSFNIPLSDCTFSPGMWTSANWGQFAHWFQEGVNQYDNSCSGNPPGAFTIFAQMAVTHGWVNCYSGTDEAIFNTNGNVQIGCEGPIANFNISADQIGNFAVYAESGQICVPNGCYNGYLYVGVYDTGGVWHPIMGIADNSSTEGLYGVGNIGETRYGTTSPYSTGTYDVRGTISGSYVDIPAGWISLDDSRVGGYNSRVDAFTNMSGNLCATNPPVGQDVNHSVGAESTGVGHYCN